MINIFYTENLNKGKWRSRRQRRKKHLCVPSPPVLFDSSIFLSVFVLRYFYLKCLGNYFMLLLFLVLKAVLLDEPRSLSLFIRTCLAPDICYNFSSLPLLIISAIFGSFIGHTLVLKPFCWTCLGPDICYTFSSLLLLDILFVFTCLVLIEIWPSESMI